MLACAGQQQTHIESIIHMNYLIADEAVYKYVYTNLGAYKYIEHYRYTYIHR